MNHSLTVVFAIFTFLAGFAQDPGTLDLTFGNQGVTQLDWGESTNIPSAVRVFPDGKIIVCGTTGALNTDNVCFVARLLADGTPDPAFGIDGKLEFNFGNTSSHANDLIFFPIKKFW